ncbi:MAG: PhoH family protein [Puniceicoccales bacterium]|jgi:phosphate starvation-inducible PhoH-like protein|nr:PhoH family protein [Puniceicoccales bacterium]
MEHTLHFPSAKHLSQLYCGNTTKLHEAEKALKLKLITREGWLNMSGTKGAIAKGEQFFSIIDKAHKQGAKVGEADFDAILAGVVAGDAGRWELLFDKPMVLPLKRCTVVPKTVNQRTYLESILANPIVFGIGPAGTGKTFLAMASAILALMEHRVQRIVLTRPAVEAGEALGYLPGDLKEKILPYLIPLYDALYTMLGRDETNKLMEKNIIEIAPLAYMRGRTLADAFIVLDEAQNTTSEQMMMFLTRLGENSRMVITGDITQVDLPRSKRSGLREAMDVLHKVPGVEIFQFGAEDVVRHPLVARIIKAYEKYRASEE